MTRRSTTWLALAGLFTAINVVGAGYAAMMGEARHAMTHVVLALIGAGVLWRIALSRSWDAALPPGTTAVGIRGRVSDRLTNLEQSIDAVAIEVERIGEGQREMTRLLADESPAPADAAPSDDRSREQGGVGQDPSSS